MKRILSILMCLCIVISTLTFVSVPASALSSSGSCGDNVSYTFDSSTGLLTISGIGDMFDSNALGWNSSIKSIVIEKGVTRIGDEVFYNCSALKSVSIPDSVTSIGDSAFVQCQSLTSISIPDSVISIGECAFFECSSLTNVTMSKCVQSFGRCAFAKCHSLTSINIPDSLTSIGDNAFYNCSSLTSINLPNSITSIEHMTFEDCSSLTNITIPNSVTVISSFAFEDCSSLTSITIPNSVTNIGTSAFEGCNSLKGISIGSGVTGIGSSAFNDCISLSKTYYTGSIDKWCEISFKDATSNPMYYTNNLFINDKLVSVVNLSSSTNINSFAFYNCLALTSITIPNSVKNIGTSAFEGCTSLKSISIPNSVINIGENAFYDCRLLKSISIPNKVNHLYEGTFTNCISLQTVVILQTEIVIDDYCFEGCRWIADVYYSGSEFYWGRAFSQFHYGNDYLVYSNVHFNYHPYKWVTTKKATYFACGSKAYKCSVCGKVSKTATIVKLKLNRPVVKYTTGKKLFKVTYTKVTGATGFEVSYTIGKKAYIKKFATTKSITKTISKLKKGSYKVKIRAFVKSGSKYAYSSYTTAKSVKVK